MKCVCSYPVMQLISSLNEWLVLKSPPALYLSYNVFCVSGRERCGACDGREWRTNGDVRRVKGASTVCLSLAGHDGILPRGSLLPPPSILLSSPLSPPLPSSEFTSLPLLFSSRHPHHNRSISYSVSTLDLEEKSSLLLLGFFYIFFSFSSLPPMDACLERLPSLCSSFSLIFTSYSSTSAFSSALAGYVFLQHATSVHHLDLCNGAAPASH